MFQRKGEAVSKIHLGIDEKNNFKVLLYALIFFLFADALVEQFGLRNSQPFINIALMATLIINIWAVDNPRTNIISWKLGATMAIAITMVTDSLIESNFLAKFQLILAFTFIVLTTWQAWGQVMFTGRVDQNKIVGAICIYLLLGLAWAFAYLIVEAFIPGSLRGLDSELWQHNAHTMIYYSMVTLTTVGYGDISPIAPLSKFLAYMESVTGIFYTTVLVASLIGIRLAGVNSTKPIDELKRAENAEAQTEEVHTG
jgi:hypothetical protein